MSAPIDSAGWALHEGFLQAIFAAPDEDTDRLVYADWLEETGEPVWVDRAEFIRVQIERFHLRNRSKNRKARLLAREAELLALRRDAWLGPWAGLAPWLVFQRGIPDRLRAVAGAWFVGRRVGRDGGFRDHLQFHDSGRFQVSFGDRNTYPVGRLPKMRDPAEGAYRVSFSYWAVGLHPEVYQVGGRTVRFAGPIDAHGGVVLNEQELRPGQEGQAVRFQLQVPGTPTGP
jgi:uncharacterized protein (TIGR02996 family)